MDYDGILSAGVSGAYFRRKYWWIICRNAFEDNDNLASLFLPESPPKTFSSKSLLWNNFLHGSKVPTPSSSATSILSYSLQPLFIPSCKHWSNKVSIEGVLRDHKGRFLMAYGRKLLHWDISLLELIAVFDFKEFIQGWMNEKQGIIIEGAMDGVVGELKEIKEGKSNVEGRPITEVAIVKEQEKQEHPKENKNIETEENEEKKEIEPKTRIAYPVKLADGKKLMSFGLRRKKVFGININIYAFENLDVVIACVPSVGDLANIPVVIYVVHVNELITWLIALGFSAITRRVKKEEGFFAITRRVKKEEGSPPLPGG
ncbi:hypothetical protein M5K25_003872 [Dendrobium thyrsiflorum]|uniref:Uncharacterized protein n=1 Tax=Dendrobium thyrsiflorum TaxID=117978 RepID=A0ABD0VS47_DENTH